MATLFKVSLLHRQIVVEVATEMVRWKVLGTDRCATEIRAAGGGGEPAVGTAGGGGETAVRAAAGASS